MESLSAFKRMVLGLPRSARDYASVAFTAQLADLLGLDLVGVFAEDEGLLDLAHLPCVREFRLPGDGWHRLDVEQLLRTSNHAAAEARRLFVDAARPLKVGARFDLVRGQIDEAIGAQTVPGDIIVVIEPRSSVERVSYQFRQFVDMALKAPAATLLIPSRISRRKGPVVAIAASQEDASIQLGLTVAQTVRERLLVLAPHAVDKAFAARLEATTSVHVDRRSLPVPEVGQAALEISLSTVGERLIVMSPGTDNLLPSRLSSERGVPVLVTPRGEPMPHPGD